MPVTQILIIDDSEADQFLARTQIQRFDPTIQIAVASDGQEALDALRSGLVTPDLILLDLSMPGMDGHEFLEAYSRQTRTAKVVVLSSSMHDKDVERVRKHEFVSHYLEKPIDARTLKDVV